MPAIQRSEFALALNQVANERGVDIEVVLDTVKNAILAAYRKDHAGIEIEEYTAELDPSTGEAHILHNGKDVTPPGFGRIAAQTAKQVILQKIREKEKEAILSDYKHKIGTVVNGMVLRFAGPNVIVDIGKTEAIMPPGEQISQEKYRLNQRMAVYLVEIKEGLRGEEIVVSRASNHLIEGLFKREVPEVSQGSVEIKEVVREPGNRSKVAVFSNQPGIDPVGSCVGQKGVRIQAIIQEFGGIEKIDIIQWTDDTKVYIANALSPAKDVSVELDEEEKVAHVTVPHDQLSLTIGVGGQNVRLASKLTGYRIEVEGKGEPVSEKADDAEKASEAEEKAEAKDEEKEGVSKEAVDTDADQAQEAEVSKSEEEVQEDKDEPSKNPESEEGGTPASTESEGVQGEEKEDVAEEDSSKEPAKKVSQPPVKTAAQARDEANTKWDEAVAKAKEDEKLTEKEAK